MLYDMHLLMSIEEGKMMGTPDRSIELMRRGDGVLEDWPEFVLTLLALIGQKFKNKT